MKRALAVTVMLISTSLVACGADDVGAAQHRLTARTHAQEAEDVASSGGGPRAHGLVSPLAVRSIVLQARAAAELRAADVLDDAARVACADVPSEVRRACPFETREVVAVRDLPSGVEIEFLAGGDDAPHVAAHARCHAAIAAQQGRASMPACPLAVRGATVDALTYPGRGVALEITARDSVAVLELQRRGHGLLSPLRAPSTR